MRLVATCLLAAFVSTGCGELGDGTDAEGFELAQVEGLDGPADYAGGNYVKVKGALTVGKTKIGALTGRDVYHGYTLVAKKGDVIRLRGLGAGGMGLTALYGPKTASGSWGSQIIKRWHYRAMERSVPIAEHTVTKAGTYLAVYGVPGRNNDPGYDIGYALTACKGECEAAACFEFEIPENGLYRFVNMVSRAEADLLVGPPGTGSSARTGSCGSQPTSCPRTRAPVCGRASGRRGEETYSNVCLAKVALRELMGSDIGPAQLVAERGACAQ